MKKLLLAMLLFATVGIFAQTTFDKVMTEKIAKIDQAKTPEDFTALSNDFARIGDKEKTQWLPYYYAAHTSIEKGRNLMRTGKVSDLDAIAAEAQNYLDKASDLSKENAELWILQKMIHSLKMMVDTQARFMSEGMLAADALSKAEKIDPENPRISLLKAEDTYYTPEQFGGSKEKGLQLFQKSMDQFIVYHPKTSLDPNWGKMEAEYFLTNRP